jgi:hypothetical protein
MMVRMIATVDDNIAYEQLRVILRGLIGCVAFDYSSMDCCINYVIPAKNRNFVASPTRFELVLSP